MKLTHISLFTGIGGFDLAAQWAGFETVLQVEIDPFCQAVLRKHFPGVPIIEDVHDVTREKVEQAIADPRQFFRDSDNGERGNRDDSTCGKTNKCLNLGNGTDSRITLLTAGVPCQPASTAGKRQGKSDDRWLWPQAIRVLSELQPAWAVFENPAGIISLDEFGSVSNVESEAACKVPDEYSGGLDELCGQIEQAGYSVQSVLIPACAVGAFHRRDRIFIIAHTRSLESERLSSIGRERISEIGRSGETTTDSPNVQRQPGCPQQRERELATENQTGAFTNSQKQGLERAIAEGRVCAERLPAELCCDPAIEGLPDWAGGEMGQPAPLTELERPGREWEAFSNIRELVDGIPRRLVRPVGNRVSQLKAYGNAVVPQQCYPILKAIAEIEGKHEH